MVTIVVSSLIVVGSSSGLGAAAGVGGGTGAAFFPGGGFSPTERGRLAWARTQVGRPSRITSAAARRRDG